MISDFFEKDNTFIYKDCYEEAEKEYCKNGVFFLSEQYISNLNLKYSLFKYIYDDLLIGAKEILNDEMASVYALFIYMAMQNRKQFMENLSRFTFPDEYEFLPLLCLLPFIGEIYDDLKARGVPEDIIAATLDQFEDCTYIYSKRYGRTGLNKRYFDFLQRYVDKKILNIGRLRFEIITLEDPVALIRENESNGLTAVMTDGKFNRCGLYSDTPPYCREDFTVSGLMKDNVLEGNEVSPLGRCKKEMKSFPLDKYNVVVKQGDICLSVHIPDKGDFSRKSLDESYKRAIEIFRQCYPELEIKAFHCESWMMAPELKEHLKSDSKILSFASDYVKYPVHTKGEDVLNFVFYLKGKTISELPEDSSLQKSLKKLYMSGDRLYEYSGLKPYV